MTEVAGKVLGVAQGGITATGTVPGGARAMAVVAWGVVAAGGTPPPKLLNGNLNYFYNFCNHHCNFEILVKI